MFSYLSRLLYKFQPKPIQKILLAALALLVIGIVLATVVRWLRRRGPERTESWTGLIVSALGNLLKVLVGLAVVAGLCMHLKFSSEEFARRRGGTSQRNFEAVKSIWGRPHVQNELSVRLTYKTTHFYDKDGMEVDPAKLKATSQPVGFRKEDVIHVIPSNAILAADHNIETAMTYRKKGGASYPTFDVDCTFGYRIANVTDRDVTAKFDFPMPTQQGLVHDLTVQVNGQPVGRKLIADSSSARWEMAMKPGQEADLAVAYKSRGLEHLRFRPGSGRQLRKYRVRLLCKGVEVDQYNPPIGGMTPQQINSHPDGMELIWKLDDAITRLDMGIILPEKKQAGYYVARVLDAGPWGMVLLVGIVVAGCLATGRPPHWLPLGVLAASYYLYYLLTAHLSYYRPGLVGGMVVSGAALTALLAIFHFAWADRFAAWSTIVLFLLFTVGYPLIRISSHSGLGLTILYVAMLAYLIVLLITHRRRFAEHPVGE